MLISWSVQSLSKTVETSEYWIYLKRIEKSVVQLVFWHLVPSNDTSYWNTHMTAYLFCYRAIHLLSWSILQRPCLKLYTGDVYQKYPGTFPGHPTATNLVWSSYPPAASSGSTTEPSQASQHFAITESSNLRNFWAVELVPVLGEKWRRCGGGSTKHHQDPQGSIGNSLIVMGYAPYCSMSF